jgi:hypothetical protein
LRVFAPAADGQNVVHESQIKCRPPQGVNASTEVLSTMTNSILFTQCARVAGVAFVVLWLSIGKPNAAHAEHAVSPNESAAGAALNCLETWLDRPADFIVAVDCMYRAWQIAAFGREAAEEPRSTVDFSPSR